MFGAKLLFGYSSWLFLANCNLCEAETKLTYMLLYAQLNYYNMSIQFAVILIGDP